MKRIVPLLLGAWLIATPLAAQDNAAITDVIGAQLQAFNDRDIAAAWDYASSNIQRLFGNPENFGAMVQQGYPMVWDNADVRYLERRDVGGFVWQKVLVRGKNGVTHVLDYQMVETPGGWQINGVQLVPAPDVGA